MRQRNDSRKFKVKIDISLLRAVLQYPYAYYAGLKHQELFQDVNTFCMFIGYPRSGHTLIGALLDAHPNMIIAHELHALNYLRAGYNQNQLYYCLLRKSQAFARSGSNWVDYAYNVPNQWQGTFTKLYVIGDKKGGSSTVQLRKRPQLLQTLYDRIGHKKRYIHIFRNPYDNISTMIRRANARNYQKIISRYFSLCETIVDIQRQTKSDEWIDLRHEAFVDDPKTYLRQLCDFLGVSAPGDYLDDCASIVYQAPHQSRHKVDWSVEAIEAVAEGIERFPYLRGYSFDR